MAGSGPRYEKAEVVLRIALAMQASAEGIGIDDIMREHRVSRRTAERLRDAVGGLFPQMAEADTGERVKRWRLPAGTANRLIDIGAAEVAALDGAAELLARENLSARADAVRAVSAKLRALLRPELRARVEVDAERLIEAEGLAMRPGPRPMIAADLLLALRQAILADRKVRLHYRARGTRKLSRNLVCPYGFLYGNRHYLVAYSMATRAYRLFSLADIARVEETPWPFERRTDFSLDAYARRSFGVFQEEPFDVAWRFSPEVADDVRAYRFHPSQTIEDQADGSVIVRFRAGGALEMCWHLFTWGEHVNVLAPRKLQITYRKLVRKVATAT